MSFCSKIILKRALRSKSINNWRLLSSSSNSNSRVVLERSRSSFLFNFNCSGVSTRHFCSPTDTQGPASIDYSALLQEDEFHKLADSTIDHLLDKIEEYGDTVDIDGFDIDYGNQVLTVKFGSLGTYVLNKQTPNRQIWMSSPVSGPSRFDWDQTAEAWIYRRTKAKLLETLESEIQQLCGEPIKLS